jgi:hypothetical protein
VRQLLDELFAHDVTGEIVRVVGHISVDLGLSLP